MSLGHTCTWHCSIRCVAIAVACFTHRPVLHWKRCKLSDSGKWHRVVPSSCKPFWHATWGVPPTVLSTVLCCAALRCPALPLRCAILHGRTLGGTCRTTGQACWRMSWMPHMCPLHTTSEWFCTPVSYAVACSTAPTAVQSADN